MSDKEKVLVFPASILEALPVDFGYSDDDHKYGNAIFVYSEEKPYFKDRAEAETDETVKQIIPYIIIRLNTEGEDKYLVYQRSKKGGETRLMGKHSIGIGGHVNESDKTPRDYVRNAPQPAIEAFYNCIRREIAEELEIELFPGYNFKGVLYDPSDAVGRVHFGFVIEMIAKNGNVKARDEAISDPHFVNLRNLKQMTDKLENWSRLVVENLES